MNEMARSRKKKNKEQFTGTKEENIYGSTKLKNQLAS